MYESNGCSTTKITTLKRSLLLLYSRGDRAFIQFSTTTVMPDLNSNTSFSSNTVILLSRCFTSDSSNSVITVGFISILVYIRKKAVQLVVQFIYCRISILQCVRLYGFQAIISYHDFSLQKINCKFISVHLENELHCI